MASDILEKITRYKLEEIAQAKAALPYAMVEEAALTAQSTMPVRGFASALTAAHKAGDVALIAEVKKASPSKGVIREDFDPAAIATAYRQGGATCLSVLTDAPSFQGAPAYLTVAREVSGLPVLRKDFIYDVYQIAQSRALGADAILLILASLSDTQLQDLAAAAQTFQMDILFEVHNEAELFRALKCQPTLIGVNNRDLHSFETSLATTTALLRHIPKGVACISESGIATPDDIRTLYEAGVTGYLVGESLMRQPNIKAATRNFTLALSGKNK